MNILIFENRQSQIDAFKENLDRFLIVTHFCDNVFDCKQKLSEIEYDLIFLDHDMEDRRPENSGTALVEWWNNQDNKNINTMTIIHSKRKDEKLKLMNDGIKNSICIRHVWEEKIFNAMFALSDVLKEFTLNHEKFII